jgi:hypothetical protein
MLATAPTGMDLMYGSNRGTGVATLHISNNSNIPAIYSSVGENGWNVEELENWFAKYGWGLSENIFEMQIQKPISSWRLGPSKIDENEWVDWDATVQVPQVKTSGTLSVTLKYVGEIQPSPFTDPWD